MTRQNDESKQSPASAGTAGCAAPGICSICDREAEVTHVAIYATGSEGLCLCGRCNGRMAEHARSLMRETTERKKAEYVAKRSAA